MVQFSYRLGLITIRLAPGCLPTSCTVKFSCKQVKVMFTFDVAHQNALRSSLRPNKRSHKAAAKLTCEASGA